MSTLRITATVVLAIAVLGGAALSQEKMTEAERAKMMAASYELARPGPEHKQLEALVGSWDQEIKVWMEPG